MIKKPSQGFTLLETIIYLALFSILMTTSLLFVYQVIRITGDGSERLERITAGAFVQQKMAYAFSEPTTVVVVSSSSFAVSGSRGVSTFSVIDGQWYLERGTTIRLPLSSTRQLVHDVVIQQLPGVFSVTFWIDSTPFQYISPVYE